MSASPYRILIIDDEPTIRGVLRLNLSQQGFQIDEAASGNAGLEKAASFHPHLIILDLGLPDIGGLEVLKSLRQWTAIPVIVLTVSDDEATKVALLDHGADDYLTKPFSTAELLARVRVAIRHHGAHEATPVFSSGDLEINLNTRQVRLSGTMVKLTATEFELLSLLVRQGGKIVPQVQILTSIWGKHASDHTHYLRIYIGQLRKKLEKDASHPKHILTESGIGYRIV